MVIAADEEAIRAVLGDYVEGWFDLDAQGYFRSQDDEHPGADIRPHQPPWKLLMLELWHRTWIDRG